MKKTVIASKISEVATDYLKNAGVEVLSFPDNPNVDKRVAHHSDLSFFFDGNDTLFVAKEMSEYADLLKSYCQNVVVIKKELGKEYPKDVLLNCVCVGRNFICNSETVSDEVFDKMKNSGYNIVDVKQGYTKCSVVPVSDNAILTDDESIYAECVKSGIDVLKVSKGSVILHGFDYGFIGGATGKISEREIIFNGDITKHPDYNEIDLFLKKYGINAISFNGKLEDIGSIILIGGL